MLKPKGDHYVIRPRTQITGEQSGNSKRPRQSENLDSFAPLYAKYSKSIHQFALKYVEQPHVAEELCQDIFLKIYQYRNSYNADLDFQTWLWTIARNTIYDYLRQSRTNPLSKQTEEDWEPAVNETAETIIIDGLERRRLLTLMATLSQRQQEAIYLRLVKKLSYMEISHNMNLSLSAVKSLINRGKATLIKLNLSGVPVCHFE